MSIKTQFEKVIETYLEEKASNDPLFAKSYSKENKTIQKCSSFIIEEVKKLKREAFTNEEIYSLAVHYYDEENIKDVSASSCHIICPTIELTKEEKEEARKQAIEEYKEKLLTKKKQVRKSKVEDCPSLF